MPGSYGGSKCKCGCNGDSDYGKAITGDPVYLFHRADGWYPLQLKSDTEARANAENNPGTLKVTEMDGLGRTVWINPSPHQPPAGLER